MIENIYLCVNDPPKRNSYIKHGLPISFLYYIRLSKKYKMSSLYIDISWESEQLNL